MRSATLAQRRQLRRLAGGVIARHYRRPLTVCSVARALSTSPRQLQRAYAQSGQSSFREDLARARLSAAAQLLAEQAIPVRDVARLVGYHQPAHFARAFRRRYGLSPARYREAARASSAARAGGRVAGPSPSPIPDRPIVINGELFGGASARLALARGV